MKMDGNKIELLSSHCIKLVKNQHHSHDLFSCNLLNRLDFGAHTKKTPHKHTNDTHSITSVCIMY